MENYNLLYDNTNPHSIELYAKKLVGKTFIDVIATNNKGEELERLLTYYGNIARKGGLGNLLEEQYFGYKANSKQEADFAEAGVELKATPYELTKKNELRAGERLVLTMINYDRPFEEDFYKSHVWEKMRLILLIYYHRNKQLNSNLLYKIQYAKLFTPPTNDLIIIQEDYKLIKEKITSGRAHELSESDTLYLGACTKGSTAQKSTVPQYYNKNVPAMKRAFCFKISYMTYVLQHYIAGKKIDTESVLSEADLRKKSFQEIIAEKVSAYIGKTDKEICEILGREYNKNKAQWVDLSYKILGIKSNKAEEFVKANIAVKSIRLEENGKMNESMSFPPIKYKEFAEEIFEESTLYNYFNETKFFFVIWKREGEYYKLIGTQLWNMPKLDLEITVRNEWEATQRVIKYGVKFERKGKIVKNNIPKKSDNEIIHLRTHADHSAYQFHDGTRIGNVEKDANELPNGEFMTTQSFWINNTYIIRQLDCLKK